MSSSILRISLHIKKGVKKNRGNYLPISLISYTTTYVFDKTTENTECHTIYRQGIC